MTIEIAIRSTQQAATRICAVVSLKQNQRCQYSIWSHFKDRAVVRFAARISCSVEIAIGAFGQRSEGKVFAINIAIRAVKCKRDCKAPSRCNLKDTAKTVSALASCPVEIVIGALH